MNYLILNKENAITITGRYYDLDIIPILLKDGIYILPECLLTDKRVISIKPTLSLLSKREVLVTELQTYNSELELDNNKSKA